MFAVRTALNTPYEELTEDEIKLPFGFLNNQILEDMMLKIFEQLPTKEWFQSYNTCRDWRELLRKDQMLLQKFKLISTKELLGAYDASSHFRELIRTNNLISEASLKREYPNLRILGPEIWGTPAECEVMGIDPNGGPEVSIVELARVVSRFSGMILKNAGVTVFPIFKGLTIRKLIEFAKNRTPPVPVGYIWPPILEEIGDSAVPRTYVAVMTTGFIIGSRGETFVEQEDRCHLISGEMPRLIDILAQSIFRFMVTGERVPFSDTLGTLMNYSRSRDLIKTRTLGVCFLDTGLQVDKLYRASVHVSVVGFCKFEAVGS